ncbi:MAG: carbohydrate-binding domain-containing protein [Bacilli bacterium]|nr:carbohydrate-binding domain-containing protein [Bacilli bacterium]
MKRNHLLVLSVLSILALVGCSTNQSGGSTSVDGSGYNTEVEVEDPEVIDVDENTGEFSISTSDGTYSKSGSIYTLSTAGTYSLSGKLEGQILVSAAETDEVVIELNGVSISYDQDSPIKAVSADKVEISAKGDTENTISDNRSAKTVDTDTLGEGAIYADCDLKLKGSGTLVVTGNYNNGVHTTKDLTIKNLTTKITGYNNAIKGNNSVTITSGTVQAYAKTGNGIKSEDNDISSSGNQKGTIAINGGVVYVDSLHDAIDSAYDVVVDQLDETVSTSVTIKTGKNSTYYSSSFKADSEKGLKALNSITINNGLVTIAASDDAVHANYGEALANGSKGLGNITVNGGTVQVASGDDGLHADNTLSITGGKIVVTNATEGFEGNYINISGGYSYIYGTDDGVNCSKKSFSSCAFTMTDGYLDVAVKSGDTDGIDSNGNFTLSGGVIVTRGGPGTTGSGMSTGLDVDGTCSMTGGTLIAFNGLERTPSTSSGVLYAGTQSSSSQGGPGGWGGGPGGWAYSGSTSVSLQAGNYTLSGTNVNISFINDYAYGSFLIYSSSLTSGSTYTLSRNNSSVLSWSQSSSSVTIS